MVNHERSVAVKQLPQQLNGRQRRIFLREIHNCMDVDRPRMVLDCSKVRQMDRNVVHLLLCCLEEAMKRNGDVKLASLTTEAGAILEITGVNRLFKVYDTTAAAVSSFDQIPAGAASQQLLPACSDS